MSKLGILDIDFDLIENDSGRFELVDLLMFKLEKNNSIYFTKYGRFKYGYMDCTWRRQINLPKY